MKTKVYLCAFATQDLHLSVKRFLNQALDLNFYQDIKVFGPKDLSKELKERISYLFKIGKKKFYAYAIWKQGIVINYINSLPENSILQYSDIGCHLNKNGIERLKDYIIMTEKNNMTVFEYGNPPKEIEKFNYHFQKYMEYEYTTGDVVKYFRLNFDSEIINTPQIWAGNFFMKKCDFSFKFLKHWGEACKNIQLLNDVESKSKNHEKFVRQAPDQSFFSIICKQNKVHTISASECEWAEFGNERKWDHLENYPILAKRDLKYSIVKRFFNRQRKNLKRFLNKLKRINSILII